MGEDIFESSSVWIHFCHDLAISSRLFYPNIVSSSRFLWTIIFQSSWLVLLYWKHRRCCWLLSFFYVNGSSLPHATYYLKLNDNWSIFLFQDIPNIFVLKPEAPTDSLTYLLSYSLPINFLLRGIWYSYVNRTKWIQHSS